MLLLLLLLTLRLLLVAVVVRAAAARSRGAAALGVWSPPSARQTGGPRGRRHLGRDLNADRGK